MFESFDSHSIVILWGILIYAQRIIAVASSARAASVTADFGCSASDASIDGAAFARTFGRRVMVHLDWSTVKSCEGGPTPRFVAGVQCGEARGWILPAGLILRETKYRYAEACSGTDIS